MSAVPDATAQCVDAPPYPGATWFDRDDAWKFHGREVEVAQLESVLIASRIVLLYSPSGAGKTSLINAGLIPLFEGRNFRVLPTVRVNAPPDGSGRNRYLVSALASLGATPDDIPAEPDLAAFLDGQPRPEGRDDVDLLILDQFEELLTLDPDDHEGRLAFFQQVGITLRDRRRWAVFAMREDYIAGLDPYRRFIPTRLATTFRLTMLGTDAAMRAIQQPARQCGVRFTDAAAAALVRELSRGGPYVEPVQLQVVCRRIWDALDPGQTVIEADDPRITGANVDTALAEHYESQIGEVVAAIGIAEYELREWFDTELISPQGIRTLVLLENGAAAGVGADAIRVLINAYLLRTYAREHATWVELAHDRLVDPVRESNRAWKATNLRDWQRQAAAWDDQRQPPTLLLAPALLPDAERWAAANAALVTARDREFLRASRAARDAAVASARSRFWWRMAIAAAALIVVLGGLTTWAIAERNNADREREIAQQERANAEAQREIAQEERANAEAQREIAQQERNAAQEDRDRAQSHVLAAQSLDTTGSRLDLSLLLGLEALDTADTPLARGSLLGVLSTAEDVGGYLRGHDTRVQAIAYSPDGTVLASADRTGAVVLWSALTGMDLGPPLTGTSGPVHDLAFVGEAGELLAGAGVSGEILMWDVATGEPAGQPLARPEGGVAAVLGVAGDPTDPTRLAAAYEDGAIVIWNIPERSEVERLVGGAPGMFADVAYTPEGVLLSAGPDRVVRWDEEDGDLREVEIAEVASLGLPPAGGPEQQATAAPAQLASMAISPDGTRVAAGTTTGVLLWWEVESEELLQTVPQAHLREVTALAFGHDGRTLASGSPDRQLRLWDHQTGQLAARQPSGYAVETYSLAFQPPNVDEPITAWYRLVSGHGDGTVVLWNTIAIPWLLTPLNQETTAPRVDSVVFAEDDATVLAAAHDGSVERWGADPWATGRVERVDATLLDLPEATRVRTLVLSPDGAVLAAGGCTRPEAGDVCTEGAIWLRDAATGEPIGDPLTVDGDWVTSLAFSPDGDYLVAGSGNRHVAAWRLGTGESLPLDQMARGPVTTVAITDGGELVLWGDAFGTLGLVRPGEERPVTVVGVAHEGPVRKIIVSPDGRLLASASNDGAVRLWDMATGTAVGTPMLAEHGPIDAIAFSPDGMTLAAAARDRTVTLWDPATQLPVAPAISWASAAGELGQASAIAYSPDGLRLALGGAPAPTQLSLESSLVLVNLDPDFMRRWACSIAGRNLSSAEVSRYLDGDDEAPACVIGEFQAAVQLDHDGDRAGAEARMRDAVQLARFSDDLLVVTQICWEGALRGYAEIVLPVCERGVELAPEDGNMQYNHGLARALAGELEPAAADLEHSVDLMRHNGWQVSADDQRPGWIAALRDGENPFTDAVLRELRFAYLEHLTQEPGTYRSAAYGFTVTWDTGRWSRLDASLADSGRVQLMSGATDVIVEAYTAAGIDPERCLALAADRYAASEPEGGPALPDAPMAEADAAALFETEGGAYLYIACRPLDDGAGMLVVDAWVPVEEYEATRPRLEALLAGISTETGDGAGEGT